MGVSMGIGRCEDARWQAGMGRTQGIAHKSFTRARAVLISAFPQRGIVGFSCCQRNSELRNSPRVCEAACC